MTAKHLLDQIVRGLDGVTAGPWREDTHLGCIVGHKGEIISGAVNGAHIIATQPDTMREIAAYVRETEARATAAEATVTALQEKLERLAGGEALTNSFYIKDTSEGKELRARMDFAQAALLNLRSKP